MIKVKKIAVLLLLIMITGCGISAIAFAGEVSGDGYAGVYNKYLWRGFDLSGNQPVAQGGIDLSAGGFTVSYWTNVQLRHDSGAGIEAGEMTENDFTVDYSHTVNDLLSVSVGNIYYQLEGIDDTNELYVSLAVDTVLSPTVSVYYDWDAADNDGLFYTLSSGHDFVLADALSLSVGAVVSYNQSSDYSVGDYRGWHNYQVSADISYTVVKNISVDASVEFSEGLSDAARDAIDSEIVSGITVTYAF